MVLTIFESPLIIATKLFSGGEGKQCPGVTLFSFKGQGRVKAPSSLLVAFTNHALPLCHFEVCYRTERKGRAALKITQVLQKLLFSLSCCVFFFEPSSVCTVGPYSYRSAILVISKISHNSRISNFLEIFIEVLNCTFQTYLKT